MYLNCFKTGMQSQGPVDYTATPRHSRNAMEPRIKPRILKGFRDVLPTEAMLRRETERALETTLRSYGFHPIDTPVLEYSEILLGKGGGETDKQVYRFHDHGDRDVAMRFDLTVPFARFMATYEAELAFPFKRYHIAKVWRGENTQRGRYREFMQCDFDIVGIDHKGADTEILLMMCRAIEKLGVENFKIHFAHRGLFNAFLDRIGGSENSVAILRIVDKLAKIGGEKVAELLGEFLGDDKVDLVLAYITRENTFESTLEKLVAYSGGESEATERLRSIYASLESLGIASRVILDPSITRGLDYYTGVVYETFLSGLEQFGSVCSGGRYNNLASLYTDREIPGVGASIGLDRLIAALSESDCFVRPNALPEVVVFNLDNAYLDHYMSVAESIRDAGFSCEVAFEKRKLNQQFRRAEKLETKIAVICGEAEYKAGKISLKQLETRENHENLTVDEAIDLLRKLLHGSQTTSG